MIIAEYILYLTPFVVEVNFRTSKLADWKESSVR